MVNVAAACTRAMVLSKSGKTLEQLPLERLRPSTQAFLKLLIKQDVPHQSMTEIREVGKSENGSAFIKDDRGQINMVDGDADEAISLMLSSQPGIGAHYATSVPHLIQIMRSNSVMLNRTKENPSVDAAPGSAKRIRKE